MVQLVHCVLNEKFCLCGWAVEVERSSHPRTLSKEVCHTGLLAHNSSFPCCGKEQKGGLKRAEREIDTAIEKSRKGD